MGSHTKNDANAVVPHHVNEEHEDEDSVDEEDDEEVSDGDLSAVTAGFTEQCKLVRLLGRFMRWLTACV